MSTIYSNVEIVKRTKAIFEEAGIPVSEWARVSGFSTALVYQVLEGKRKCVRGQSHQIAVALGLKPGLRMNVEQLALRLTRGV